jgi:thioredoxin 1
MSETDELDELREQKAEELKEQATGSDTPSEPVHVEGADHLDELVADNEVVLVDFYADWCGPCQMLEPTVEAVAEETQAVVAKVDVDAHQQLAGQYGVRGVPTLVLFVDGEQAEQVVGVREKDHFVSLIERHTA